MIAEIIIDIANSNIDRVFDYLIEIEIEDVAVGCRVLVPFGKNRQLEGMITMLKETSEIPNAKLKKVIRIIDEAPVVTSEQMVLAKYIKVEYHTTLAFALRLMYPAAVRGERVKERTVRMAGIADREILLKERELCFSKNGNIRAAKRLSTIDFILEGDVPAPKLKDSQNISYLESCGAVRTYQERKSRRPQRTELENRLDVAHTPAQREAIRQISAAINSGTKNTILLHGVTGSGKTEVYMQCIQNTLDSGKTAMLLVPEISLTAQLYSILGERFGDKVCVFHSGLSAGERYDEWDRVRSGEARIVMGARSAVFMPLENIGLIIVDEEHEQSYQSENHPMYHAAEVARMRIHSHNATLLLASATPRIESYMKARLGIYSLVELSERVLGLAMPALTVVDMKQEFMKGNKTIISGELYSKLKETYDRGEQSLVFVNRRGFAGSVVCMGCGHVRMCSHCDVPLKYHKSRGALLCHYCGREFPFTKECPDCGDAFSKLSGVGTEQVEQQIKHFFPLMRTLRMDFDTTRHKGAYEEIYTKFKRREADVLIGTRMIARGLDFDFVTLAVIISAEAILSFGDYRAEEQTFSLIEQVGGRAGRKKPGNVIVQTYNPDHYAVLFAQRHDYKGFYTHEIAMRKALNRPPFSKLFRFVFSDSNFEKASKACEQTEKKIEALLESVKSDIILLTAKAAPIEKLDGKSRFHILIKLSSVAAKRELKEELFNIWECVRKLCDLVELYINPYDVN